MQKKPKHWKKQFYRKQEKANTYFWCKLFAFVFMFFFALSSYIAEDVIGLHFGFYFSDWSIVFSSHIKLHQKRCRCEKPRSFNDFWAFLRPFLEAWQKDAKMGFGKFDGPVPLPKAFWAAFPRIFRESGSFLSSAKCRISTGVFVGLAECELQAQIPTR